MVRLAQGRHASWRPGRWLTRSLSLFLLLLWAPAAQCQATAPHVPAVASSSSLSLPSDLLPLPGTPAFQRGQQQRQLAAVLRGFEGVTSAQVVIAGEPAGPRVSVLLKLNPRTRVRPALVESMASVVLSAVPGLVPERLTLTTATGETLYAGGAPRIERGPPPVRSAGLSWAPALAGGLLAVLLTGWCYWRSRSPRNVPDETGLGFLATLNHRQLDVLFQGERAEVVGILATMCSPTTARRLQRYARSRGLTRPAPSRGPSREVRQVVALALQAKARRHGIGVGPEGGES